MNLSKNRRIVFILASGGLLTLLMILLAIRPIQAAGPWYVAPGGEDGNDCLSPGAPCATINGAIGKASPGDTIYVAVGTYTGTGDEVVSISKSITLSGGWDADFTTRAYAPPEISVSPDELTSTQEVGEIVDQELTISNGNGVTLTYNIVGAAATDAALLFHLDEPAGATTFQDASGNDNHGSCSGASCPTAGVDGRFGTAVGFDGSDDYVIVGSPVPATLQIQDEISLEAWIYATEYPAPYRLGTIVGCQYDPGKSGYAIHLDGRTNSDGQPAPPGHISFQIGDGNWHVTNVNAQVPLNQWVHIVAVREANEDARVYYNGVLQPSTSVPWNGSITYSGAELDLGRQSDYGSRFFDGVIDEVAIYDRALSAQEVGALYLHGPGGSAAPWLSMDPVSGTVSTNSSVPVQVTFDATGLQPDTYDTQIVIQSNDPISPQLSIPVTMTVEPTANMGWVGGTVTDAGTGDPLEATVIAMSQPYIITTHPDTGVYLLWLDEGSYTLQVTAEGYFTTTAEVEIVAQQGTTQDFALVLDVPVIEVSPESLEVTHSVGDVTMRTLTIGNDGPAPLEFDIGIGRGAALDFDGLDDQLNMGNSDVLMLTDSDFTIEAWISTTQTLESTAVHKHSSGWWNGYFVNINYPPCGANKACFYTAEGSGHAASTTDVNDGQWHHIAAVYHGSGTKQLFVDGVLEDTKPAPVYIPPNTEPFRVGCGDTLGLGNFQGLIDEVRVWNVARSEVEIQSAMSTPLSGNEPGLVGYWKLDEGSGQIAYDSIANGNNGQLGTTPGVDPSDPTWLLVSPQGGDVLWLTIDPISGTVPAESTTPIQVTFDATATQPGTYNAELVIRSDDPFTPTVSVPVTMTVEPMASMGWVEGMVTDSETDEPLGATIIAIGQPYTVNTDPDTGSYTFWLDEGSYTLRVTSERYITESATVEITAQQGITQDFALDPLIQVYLPIILRNH